MIATEGIGIPCLCYHVEWDRSCVRQPVTRSYSWMKCYTKTDIRLHKSRVKGGKKIGTFVIKESTWNNTNVCKLPTAWWHKGCTGLEIGYLPSYVRHKVVKSVASPLRRPANQNRFKKSHQPQPWKKNNEL